MSSTPSVHEPSISLPSTLNDDAVTLQVTTGTTPTIKSVDPRFANLQRRSRTVMGRATIEGNRRLSPDAAKNLSEAESVLLTLKETVYHRRNFKSTNRLSTTKDPAAELQRRDNARQQIDHIRETLPDDTVEAGRRAREAHGHNCLDLVLAGQHILRDKKISSTRVLVKPTGIFDGHALLLLGNVPEGELPERMEDWPKDLAICDAWSNIACPAHEFPGEFKRKMQEWDNGKKKILKQEGEEWISPADDRWTSYVLEGGRSLDRQTVVKRTGDDVRTNA